MAAEGAAPTAAAAAMPAACASSHPSHGQAGKEGEGSAAVPEVLRQVEGLLTGDDATDSAIIRFYSARHKLLES